MCGFVTVVEMTGQAPNAAILADMARVIDHRGPDADGSVVVDNVGMHHKRLSIIDLASGQQPMSRDGVTLVFNGEIYNFVELRETLQKQGYAFSTQSDTEVLLVAYLAFGAEFVKHLRGMFAFVLYDQRRHQVLAARDHFGIKPLYRLETPQRTVYVSEIKSLFQHPELRAELEHEALTEYLTFQHTLGSKTLFRGVSKLLPAHLEITDARTGERFQQTNYWAPSYSLDHSLTEASATERLRELLTMSVNRQLRSDVRVGAYLSGGLDSSSVAVLAARGSGNQLATFTGAFKEGIEYDESRYAQAVADQIESEHHLVYPSRNDFVDSLESLSFSMDEPAAGPGLFPQYMVSSLAARHVKVCLGGQGGDEIFGGYARYLVAYLESALAAQIDNGGAPDSDGISLEQLAAQLPVLKQYKPMLRQFFSHGFFADDRTERYFQLLDRSASVRHLVSRAVLNADSREMTLARFRDVFNLADTDSYINQMTAFDMRASLPALLQVEDRVSMRVSLESRVPLLDPDIVDFAASVPLQIKWKGGEPKYLLKRAVEPWLPKQVYQRTDKMGFPVPLQDWAKGEARDFVLDILLSQRAKARDLFDLSQVETLVHNEGAFGRGLWALLQLELWHRNFIDNSGQETIRGERRAADI